MLPNRSGGLAESAAPPSGVGSGRSWWVRLFGPRPAKLAGGALFDRVAAQARTPALYSLGGVPDTVEGRFECYALHVDLVLHRLKRQGPEAAEVAQALFDCFLANLDEGLRDMGVGDLSVGKKMRKLGEAIYGRMRGYDAALDSVMADEASSEERAAGAAALAELIGRVLFANGEAPEARPLAAYVTACARALAAQPLDEVQAADLKWPLFDGRSASPAAALVSDRLSPIGEDHL